jgi:hypothetical protein
LKAVLLAALVCSVLAAALLGRAAADPGELVVLGKGSASGKKAHVVVVVPKVGSFPKVTVEVVAKPRQRAEAGWVMLCGAPGLLGRNGRDVHGRTPLWVTVDVGTPSPCRLTALATLSKKGRVTVTVVGRGR